MFDKNICQKVFSELTCLLYKIVLIISLNHYDLFDETLHPKPQQSILKRIMKYDSFRGIKRQVDYFLMRDT